MGKFAEFLKEQNGEKPYRFVALWYNDPSDPDNSEINADEIMSAGKSMGLKGFKVDVDGAYSDKIDGKRYIFDKDDNKFLCDENTIVFVRAAITLRRSWSDVVTQLEKDNIFCVNSRMCMESCADKFRTYITLAESKIKQPKTVLVNHKEKIPTSFDRLKTKYPVIVKTIAGSLGVGVIKVENEGALVSTVQIIDKLEPNLGILVQEFIKTDFDVRVIVIAGKVHGAIMRPVLKKDFRSNVALGSKPEKFELTELEKNVCEKTAKSVNGLWVGVDFITSKNRENEEPYIIEVNSSPGTKGYKDATKTNLVKDVMTTFLNRKNWLKLNPIQSIYEE
jgi:ribosomal protein S6--L-glutamate ligase|tara:strand:+ start:333 stop:1337 length:1005 start_codon:yes stop_codon:yes gene_type:complete